MPAPPTRSSGRCFCAGCGEKAPPPPVVTLAPPPDTVSTTLSEVTSGAWLGGTAGRSWRRPTSGGGRRLRHQRSVDAARRRPAARSLRNPSTLFRAGDTLYVGDWGLRRTSRWTLDGRFAGATPTTDAVRGVLPRARDGAGRYYLELRPRPGADGQGNRDSAAVVRAPARVRPGRHARPARAARHRRGHGRGGPALRAAGVQRSGPVGRAA